MILDEIAAAKRAAHARRDPLADRARRDLWERGTPALAHPVRSLRGALRPEAPTADALPRVIAEFKRRSPSAGPIRPAADVAEVTRNYAGAGAAALSVLTDPQFFDGELAHLGQARAAAPRLPILRKDFVLFEDDLVDARIAGADAVLLIARLLDDARLGELVRAAERLGLESMVEVHDERECAAAAKAGASIVGVNHRDLDTLAIDLELSRRLAPLLPPQAVRVAESGLRRAEDLREMRARGYDAVLVGEALMRAASPGGALRELLGSARHDGEAGCG